MKLCFVEIPSYLGRRPFITGKPTEAFLPQRIMATDVAMVHGLIALPCRLLEFKLFVWNCLLRFQIYEFMTGRLRVLFHFLDM